MNKILYKIRKIIFKISEIYDNRDIINKYETLKVNTLLNKNEIEDLQLNKLKEILKYAYYNIEFYKDIFDRIGFNVNEVKSLDDLKKLPIIDKQIIINNETKFYNKNLKLIERKTGGSTGSKLKIYYDRFSLDMTAAINIRCLEWAGKLLGEKEVHFSTNLNNKISFKDSLITKAKQFALRRKDIFVDFSNKENYELIINQLNNYNPKLVQGFPSFMYSLATFAKNNNVYCKKFQIFESTGEQLYSFQKDLIEEIFGCKVFNRYGDAEFGIIAFECNKHCGLHICQDNVIVENLTNINGENELIVTTLSNKAMPLIRYRTGDLGTIIKENCDCGNNFAKIDNIKGRVHDFIKISDGKYVSTSFFLDILDKYSFMDDFQLFDNENQIYLLLKLKSYTPLNQLVKLQEEVFNILLLQDKQFNIVLVGKYNYSSAGKFRYIINDISNFEQAIKIVENKYKMIFGGVCCIQGFNLPEEYDNIIQVWATKTGKIMFSKPIKELEICNLLINNRITFYLDNTIITSINLGEGWFKYTVNFEANKVYSFKVDKELSERQKGKDPRELAVAFKFLKRNC